MRSRSSIPRSSSSCRRRTTRGSASRRCLELLAAVPAGKLAIADLAVTTEHEVHELERAGVDAVIVHAADVSPLARRGLLAPEVVTRRR